ncbi:hypothetical protein SAY86_020831 [Trapa natans]|uniref:Uncharacterized protein n=1 Tax=Trapa natans TaxID=22666 RepID=A0AAN7RCL1_TRANT|nr:hypothetical protein SAY86_020831 [Trapa natans]
MEIQFGDNILPESDTEEVLGMKAMVLPILDGILPALRRIIARRVSLKKQLKRRLNVLTTASATCFMFPVAMWDKITDLLLLAAIPCHSLLGPF